MIRAEPRRGYEPNEGVDAGALDGHVHDAHAACVAADGRLTVV